MKLSNGVEEYRIEVTKMGQNYPFFSYSTDQNFEWAIAAVSEELTMLQLHDC